MNIVGKRVAYITLGCKLNFSETSTIKHNLEQEGAVTVGEKDGADIFVINTCSVTDIAEKKGRQMIRKIIHRNPGSYIVVVGCYAQLRAQEIMNIEGVHLVLNARDKFNVAHYLNHLEEQERHEPHSCDIFEVKNFDLAYSYGDRTRCFLKIQDGCDYFCSYCTIPFARGRSRSAAIQDVIKAARDVASKGIKEIILTGVNTGDFGRETGETFLDLIRTLDELEEILGASRIPFEQREASRKMGSRFAKTIEKLHAETMPMKNREIFEAYLDARKGKAVSHCIVYGVFCAALGIEEEETLYHYLYAQTSAMVTNCVKTIPLSQSAGQQLLSGCYPEFAEILEEIRTYSEDDLCLSAPGFDIRGIQHEKLYSRLYMS